MLLNYIFNGFGIMIHIVEPELPTQLDGTRQFECKTYQQAPYVQCAQKMPRKLTQFLPNVAQADRDALFESITDVLAYPREGRIREVSSHVCSLDVEHIYRKIIECFAPH